MGLDMYLLRKGSDCEELENIFYWRKANSIHNYFSRLFNGSINNCELYLISIEQLMILRDLCAEVLEKAEVIETKELIKTVSINTKYKDLLANGYKQEQIERVGDIYNLYYYKRQVINSEKIAGILEVQGGFFFGSTEYNECYLEDVKETLDFLNTYEFCTLYNYYYCAWW